MHQVLLMVLGLLTLVGLMGCQAPTAASTVSAAERPAQATIRLGGYKTLALVEAYRLQHVDHVRLRLLKKNAQGAYVATGVTRAIAPAALASPVSLGNLKLGQAYRVQADAFADAAETALIRRPSTAPPTSPCRVSPAPPGSPRSTTRPSRWPSASG